MLIVRCLSICYINFLGGIPLLSLVSVVPLSTSGEGKKGLGGVCVSMSFGL